MTFGVTLQSPLHCQTKLPQNSGPFIADNAGGAAATYVPTTDGNYTFVFNFPGQTITGNANTGVPAHPTGPYIGDVYGGSTSLPSTVSVGATPAYTIPENPLPTGYWQNPVEAFNHNWYAISGDWLGLSACTFAATGVYGYTGNYNPYTQPVLSAHIIWTKPEAFGGQIGGQSDTGSTPIVGYGNETSIYYTGAEYQPKFSPIVLNGIVYYTDFPSSDGSPNGWIAVSLRTGQVLWTKNTTEVLLCGQIFNYKSINQYGAYPYLWATRTTFPVGGVGSYSAGSFLDMFDAMTGKYILTINHVTFGTKIEGTDGSILMYYVNTTSTNPLNPTAPNNIRTASLSMWNSSKCISVGESQFTSFGTGSIVSAWIPGQNQNLTWSTGIEWSVPIPQSYQGNAFYYPGVGPSSFSIRTIDQSDQIIVLTVSPGNLSSSNWEVQAGYTMGGTPDGVSGVAKQLWMANNTITPYTTRASAPSGDGIYTEYQKETMQVFGYNVHTGAPVWNAYYNDNPLAYYDQASYVYGNGQLYTWTFSGWVYDYNMTNGNLIWKWSDGSAGENTPYGVNPLWIIGNAEGTLAGGVFYVETGHNYGPPLFSGAQIYAINAT